MRAAVRQHNLLERTLRYSIARGERIAQHRRTAWNTLPYTIGRTVPVLLNFVYVTQRLGRAGRKSMHPRTDQVEAYLTSFALVNMKLKAPGPLPG